VADPRALVFDYGGVLTTPLQDSMSSWCEDDGIDLDEFRRALATWFGAEYGGEAAVNPIHALERGELEVPDFERELAKHLKTRNGLPVEPDGLITRMFAGFSLETAMFNALRHARAAGITTGLLSNSWGLDYPREEWDELFDVTVISGEIGMRKPEPEIYHHLLDKLGLPAEEVVFVDDLKGNIDAAVETGIVGIHHVTPQQSIEELEALFKVPLRGQLGRSRA
jgi:putative hydrolase of the HAD superfamily